MSVIAFDESNICYAIFLPSDLLSFLKRRILIHFIVHLFILLSAFLLYSLPFYFIVRLSSLLSVFTLLSIFTLLSAFLLCLLRTNRAGKQFNCSARNRKTRNELNLGGLEHRTALRLSLKQTLSVSPT
jgi:hypothetical protein